MKKILGFCLSMALLTMACGGGNETNKETSGNDTPPESMIKDNSKENTLTAGKAIYAKTCQACHQESGVGVAKTFPPLAKSDMLNADVNGAIDGVLYGRKGEIVVNGEKYNLEMAPVVLNDEEVASVLTYVYNSWDNNKTIVTPAMVASRRKK